MSRAIDERRESYDAIAPLYERARPGYPAALFDDIVAYAELNVEARLLEVGCGTGQATLPLAERGFTIDCVELGAELAALAREKLARWRKIRVMNAAFETVALRPRQYDLVYAATAFHWIDAAIRFKKAHELLKPGGALALFWHRPCMTDVSRRYIDALQGVYRRFVPQMARDFALPPAPAAVRTEYDQLIRESGFFGELEVRKHYGLAEYSAASYIDLLRTFSDHIALPAATQGQLFKEVAALISDEFAGVLPRETVALLYLARRV